MADRINAKIEEDLDYEMAGSNLIKEEDTARRLGNEIAKECERECEMTGEGDTDRQSGYEKTDEYNNFELACEMAMEENEGGWPGRELKGGAYEDRRSGNEIAKECERECEMTGEGDTDRQSGNRMSVKGFEPYSYACALFFYNSESLYKRIPQNLKYKAGIAAGRFFARMLGARMATASWFDDVDVVIPVPLHWTRRWSRGYNQAEVIARELAAVMASERRNTARGVESGEVKMEVHRKERTENKEQTGMGRTERTEEREQMGMGRTERKGEKEQMELGWVERTEGKEQMELGWVERTEGKEQIEMGRVERKGEKEQTGMGRTERTGEKEQMELGRVERTEGKEQIEMGRVERTEEKEQMGKGRTEKTEGKEQMEMGGMERKGEKEQIEEIGRKRRNVRKRMKGIETDGDGELGSVAPRVRVDVLRRARRTGTQTRLSGEAKARNVAGAFSVRPRAFSEGNAPAHILLVDDTFTTGATLNACRHALRAVLPSDVRISYATLAFVTAM